MEKKKLTSEMNRGFIQLIVLECISKGGHGYGVMKKIHALGYEFIEENTLYPLLRRMEKNQWAESKWVINDEQPQKIYTITQEGLDVKNQLYEIWSLQSDTLRKVRSDVNE